MAKTKEEWLEDARRNRTAQAIERIEDTYNVTDIASNILSSTTSRNEERTSEDSSGIEGSTSVKSNGIRGSSDNSGNNGQSVRKIGSSDSSTYQETQGTLRRKSIFDKHIGIVKEVVTKLPHGKKGEKKEEKEKLLDKRTAALKRDQLISAITWFTDTADNFIIATTKPHDRTLQIWSNMTPGEIEILADFLLKQGQEHVFVAKSVNKIIETYDGFRAGLIVVPRAYLTIMYYLQNGFSIK